MAERGDALVRLRGTGTTPEQSTEGHGLCTGITEAADRWELLAWGDQWYLASGGVGATIFPSGFFQPLA